ncbi:transposase [Melaminivora sp.]|jgi:transposase
MTKKPRKYYEPAFKLQAAKMVREQGLSIVQVSKDLGIGRTAITRWVQQYDAELAGEKTTGPGLTPEQVEIRKLERENHQLRQDVELLKKASAFFAQAMR